MNNQILKDKIKKLVNHYNAENYKLVIDEANILLKKLPKNSFLINLLGSSFQRLGDQVAAKKIFLHLLQIDSDNIHAMNNLANTLKILNEFSLAEEYYIKALNIDPNYIQGIVNLGNLNYKLNNFNKATELFKKALTINNNDTLIHYNIGLNYQSLGLFDNAKFHFNEIIRIDPNNTLADRLISRITKYTNNDPHLNKMIKKLTNQNLDENSKINLCFSLGKAFEDLKKFDKSYFYLEQGNSLKNKICEFDVKKNTRLIKNIINSFEKYNFDKISDEHIRTKDKNIIFILGMPRSGTSLVEQIISSHPKVYGAGELDYLESLIKQNSYNEFNTTLSPLDDAILSKIRTKYYELINQFNSTEDFITDKALHNFLWIGFIKLLFPNAKVIHCTRNRKDNCLSIYKSLFDENVNWAYSQTKILSFYKDYHLIMKFWKNKIPDFIYDISYEELITNPRDKVENLLNFCDLNWNDSCLEFHKTKRQVKTVSFAQVRKPIYNTSVNLSKNFEPFLSDFFLNLDNIQ